MLSQAREKIALGVFVFLIVLSLCGFGWYLSLGHSWNIAASNIDDKFGSMDGYIAIVYAGTVPPKTIAEKPVERPRQGIFPEENDSRYYFEGNMPDENQSPRVSGKEQTSPDSDAAGYSASQNRMSDSLKTETELSEREDVPLSVSEVRKSYEAKNATVLELNTLNPHYYDEGLIVKKGRYRFGIVSFDRSQSKDAIEQYVDYFTLHATDFIIVITDDKSSLDGISGIDIVISLQSENPFPMGENMGSTFYVDAPEIGKVGAVVVSSNNVVSAKVLEDL